MNLQFRRSETGSTVPVMNQPLICYNITVGAGCDGGYIADPAAFATADHAAWSRIARHDCDHMDFTSSSWLPAATPTAAFCQQSHRVCAGQPGHSLAMRFAATELCLVQRAPEGRRLMSGGRVGSSELNLDRRRCDEQQVRGYLEQRVW